MMLMTLLAERQQLNIPARTEQWCNYTSEHCALRTLDQKRLMFMGNEDLVGWMGTHRCRNGFLKLCAELVTENVQQQTLTPLQNREREKINYLQFCKY